jgi:ferredoxin
MANEPSNCPPNAPGKYYVYREYCLSHGCCAELAPNNFMIDGPHEAYVYKQPETPEEERQCREAMECCPMAAIFDDGAQRPSRR